MSLDPKILNQLKHGRTADGKVGAKVTPTEDNPSNQAWITVVMRKAADFTGAIAKYHFLNYEIEYVEFDEKYNEELHGLDWDMFMVRTETFHNIKDESDPIAIGLVRILGKWLANVNDLQPFANIGHPTY